VALSQFPRIAVLLDHIESDYHEEVVAGVHRAARASRVRVVIVAGGWLGQPPEEPVTRNFIYDRVRQARVDGIIVLGGSLANFCGLTRFRQWMRDFRDVPSVTIGLDLDDLPCVRADNEAGVRAVVRHLIEVHGRRRIACVRGPSAGPEAEARYRAYRMALTDHGLRIDDRMVVQQSRLGWNDGMAAVGALFDDRRFTPRTLDAIVCVNDDVARGALEALRQRSIAVPDQVAVVGFDNGASARSANPPLTTVDQRVEQQAYAAARQLIEALEQGKPPESVVLATDHVLRSSCGCSPPLENDSTAIQPPETGVAHTCRLALIERRAIVAAELLRAAGGRLINAPGWELRVLDALLRDLTTADTGHVVRELESLARRHASDGGDVAACQDVLTALRLQALACGALEPDTRPRLEDLFQESRLVLGRIGVDVERSRHQTLNLRVRTIAKQCNSLLDQGTFADVAKLLEEHLPAIGIQGFLISRFVDPGDLSAELEVISRRSQGVWRAPEKTIAPQRLGLDTALEQEGIVVLEPLEFGSVPLGMAAFTWGAEMPAHYEQLREVLSTALRALQIGRR
jgi:DNA-binding LacI/PurR family transcriptional regulator